MYMDIVSDVNAKYEEVDSTVSDNLNPRAKFAGCLVRTAGHDFMDYREVSGVASGGSDGCINFADGDNTGLADCLESSGLPAVFEDYCTSVSLADFLVIAGEAVMGRTAERYSADNYYEKGTVAEAFLENFIFGRSTAYECPDNSGLMPNPELGCDGLEDIFVDHIYKGTDREWEFTAAISGAHTLGSASIENSGYNGFWSSSDQSGKFNNDYYTAILAKGWAPELAVDGNSDKNQWKRIDQAIGADHKEMMLSTDMCLAYNGNRDAAGCRGRACRNFEGQGDPLLA